MAAEITLDELLGEYEKLWATSEAKGLTTVELQERWGVSRGTVLKALRAAQAQGILRTTKKRHMRVDGAKSFIPCYWIERPKPTKKRGR